MNLLWRKENSSHGYAGQFRQLNGVEINTIWKNNIYSRVARQSLIRKCNRAREQGEIRSFFKSNIPYGRPFIDMQ